MERQRDLRGRTQASAVEVVRFVGRLPRGRSADILGRQLLRCGTSVGANYRAACRARSRKAFVARLGIVEEAADEATYWMDLLAAPGCAPQKAVQPLRTEANELLAITIASIRTAKRNRALPRTPPP